MTPDRPIWWRLIKWLTLSLITSGTARGFFYLLEQLRIRPEVWLVDLGLKHATAANIEIVLIALSLMFGLALAFAIVWMPVPIIDLWSRFFGKRIPMGETARIAYEETRGEVIAQFAEALNDGSIISYYADFIGRKVPIYGARPPSTKPEVIDPEVFFSTRFTDDGNSLVAIQADRPLYVDIRVGKRDLKRLIVQMKAIRL